VFGLPALGPRDLLDGVVALTRAGVIRPLRPRLSLLGLALELPLVHPNLGMAVAFQAATQPDEVAVIDDRGILSWAELDGRTSRLANILLQHGKPGGCVAFMVRNGREALECYAAGGRSGLAPVPLNTFSTGSEIGRILHMQRPAVLVADEEFAPVVEHAVAHLDDPPVVLVVGEDGTYESALASASTSAPLVRGTAKVVIHTSGTTGAPKGAERHVGMRGAGAALGFITRIPLRRDDRILVAPPMFHGFAAGVAAAAVLVGATCVLPRRFDAAGFQAAVDRHDLAAAALVPIMLQRALDESPHGPSSSLRMIVTSGSALPVALRDRAQARWGEVVHDLYGSTEAGWVAISTPADFRRRRGTVGRPGPGMTVEVVDARGRRLPPGEIGQLRVTTGTEFAGYTGHDTHLGPVEIGDLGYVDADGFLFVTGRRDDMIISGGENVYPSEVEEVLAAHPALVESAVIGVDDEEFGQVLRAYVVGPVNGRQVREWLKERLAGYKVPKRVVVVDELPRNATGKVLKRRLLQSEHPSRG